ncbi:MAG: response regulator [Candidatus Heimdallarchaeota archaeon]|nr:response regulator [Candidatus Heimdallarchaeota archaeon]
MAANRVLIVEDELEIRETYSRFLRRRGFEVDAVENLLSALEAVNNKTYHVALIDVMLAGQDRTNRDGRAVGRHIVEVNEGTVFFFFSAQDDPQLSADLLQSDGALGYLSKAKIRDEGMHVLSDSVIVGIDACVLHPFGLVQDDQKHTINNRTAMSYVGGVDVDQEVFRDRGTRAFASGSGLFREFLQEFLSKWAPLLYPLNLDEKMTLTENPPLLHGRYWSKVVGEPISLLICNTSDVESIIDGSINEEWSEETEIVISDGRTAKGNLTGLVFKSRGRQRSEFSERLPLPIKSANIRFNL